jgi:predicted transcriptional regulator
VSISDLPLKELLSLSLFSTPAVSIRQENKMWIATGMLVHYLESFTDSLVVTDQEEKPIGVIGGAEIINNIFENSTSDFFDKRTVEEIFDKELIQVNSETKLKDLIEKWKITRRAFSVIPNQYYGYSAISSRKLLEIGANCKTDIRVGDLPKKKTIATFNFDDTIGKIINMMFENKTRKILLKNSQSFISDRIIIQTVAQNLDYLRGIENFLDMKFEKPFQLPDAKIISEDLNFADLSKLMFGMMYPFVITKEHQVYSPWDVCQTLLSKDIEYQNQTPN